MGKIYIYNLHVCKNAADEYQMHCDKPKKSQSNAYLVQFLQHFGKEKAVMTKGI